MSQLVRAWTQNKSWLLRAAESLLPAILLLVWFSAEAFARAGGGGGYSGGGGGGGFSGGGFSGGSSGSSSGGGDGLGLFYLIFWLCVNYPLIGIPLVIGGGVALFYFGQQGQKRRVRRTLGVGRTANQFLDRAELSAQVQKRDPGFSEHSFYDRVDAAFLKIQHAWCNQNMEPARAFVSDGIYERFSLQIAEQRDLGYRDQMENILVKRIQLADLVQDTFFETVTVRIQASARDQRVSLQTGKPIAGFSSRSAETFVEYWSFVRRRGVKTEEKPGLIEGCCPNCGAEIELNRASKCGSCDSLIRSGEYDWILAEITQEIEWQPSRTREIPGEEAFRHQHDPGFHAQHIEDRASVVFWRRAMALRLGTSEAIRKMATPAYCDTFADEHQFHRSQRSYLGDCAVGSVEVRGVLAAEHFGSAANRETEQNDLSAQQDTAEPLDRVLVELRWSGHRFEVKNGKVKKTDSGIARKSLLVLVRRPGVKTNVGESITSAHCPSCGAPETDLTSNSCEFCGAELNSGRYDWVLEDFLSVHQPEAVALLQKVHNLPRPNRPSTSFPSGSIDSSDDGIVTAGIVSSATPGGVGLLTWAVKMAFADGHLDAQEEAMLREAAKKQGVDPETLQRLIDAARADDPTRRDQTTKKKRIAGYPQWSISVLQTGR